MLRCLCLMNRFFHSTRMFLFRLPLFPLFSHFALSHFCLDFILDPKFILTFRSDVRVRDTFGVPTSKDIDHLSFVNICGLSCNLDPSIISFIPLDLVWFPYWNPNQSEVTNKSFSMVYELLTYLTYNNVALYANDSSLVSLDKSVQSVLSYMGNRYNSKSWEMVQ